MRICYRTIRLDQAHRALVLGGPEVREVVLADEPTIAVATTAPADEADLRLKDVYRVAEPFLRSTFTRMGDDALDRLAATMAHAE